jgi:hypothetical protein
MARESAGTDQSLIKEPEHEHERTAAPPRLRAPVARPFQEIPRLRVVAINGWNRLNVAFRTTPGSKDEMLGLDKAGLKRCGDYVAWKVARIRQGFVARCACMLRGE